MLIYLISLLILVILHYSFRKFSWMFLLSASFAFYASIAGLRLLCTLLLLTIITYLFALLIEKITEEKKKLFILSSAILIILLPLIILKYSYFLTSNINLLFVYLRFNTVPIVTIPKDIETIYTIGLSFYTFQAISYLIDTYLEIVKPEKHLGYFSLYLSFFPKILQGPIERADLLIPALKWTRPFKDQTQNKISILTLNDFIANARIAFLLIIWGAFKKFVIADRLGLFVDEFYSNHDSYKGIISLIPIIFYSFQIYCDFSGYTDAALGIARLFGIKLTDNFNSPYFATSVADFWRRWHITLTKWLMDYIFRPISMSFRKNRLFAINFAIFITFLVCGIWHGPSWNFIVWGTLNGLYIIFSNFSKKRRDKLTTYLFPNSSPANKFVIQGISLIFTFSLVSVTWIFFRSHSIEQALKIIINIFDQPEIVPRLKQSSYDFFIAILGISSLLSFEILKQKGKTMELLFKRHLIVQWVSYSILLFAVIFLSIPSETKFIYFEF
ncbi:MAG: MBOAT family protein [Oligoflexia bacterium]|nr:MBOAT family protein [Oligoflexia bacterium]